MAFQMIRFALLMIVCLALLNKAQAQTPGTLDNTFAGTGTTTIDFSPVYQSDVGTATLVQPDGKILVGGITNNGAYAILMRLNANGSTDLSFGSNGSTVVPSFYELKKLALQSDGKIIAVGKGTSSNLVAYRFTSSGLIDSAFGGGDGVFSYVPSAPVGFGSEAEATDVAVLGDDKILIVGFARLSSFTPPNTQSIQDDQILMRLNANGTLDNTFNGTGIQAFFRYAGVISPPMSFVPTTPSKALSVSVQADGKIVVGGTKGVVVSATSQHQNITVARFLSTGALDNAFNGSGLAEFNLRTSTIQGNTFSSSESAVDIEALPDGKILILSNVADSLLFNRLGLVRVAANGVLDATFGNGGALGVFPALSNRWVLPSSMASAGQGKFYLGGFENFQGGYAHTVIRVDSLGRLDSSFNASGSVRIENTWATSNRPLSLARQPDGKLIVVGNFQGRSFLAARLNANGSFDNSFNGTGIRVFNNSNPISQDFANVATIAPDGKIVVAGYGGDGNDIAVASLNADGTLSANFGNAGRAVTPITSGAGILTGIAVQTDGKVLVIRASSQLYRIRTTGVLDSSFGSSGVGYISVSNVANINSLSNGKILLTGSYNNAAKLVMLNPNGSSDNTFGSNGAATVAFGTSSTFCDALILSGGKILAFGYDRIDESNSRIMLARFNANGALDTSFSGDGIATISNLNANPTCVAIQSDGKCLVGGLLSQSNPRAAFVARFLANGDLDTTFGMNADSTFFRKGVARIASSELNSLTAFSVGKNAAIFVEGDGKIIVAHRASTGVILFRVRENGMSVANNAIDSTFAGDGVAGYNLPSGVTSGASGFATQPDGRPLLVGTVMNSNGAEDFWVARIFNSVRFGSSVSAGQTGQIVLGGSGATVNITGNAGTGGAITASVGINPNIVGALPSGVNQLLRDRFWTITSTATGLTYNLTLDFSGVSGIRNFNLIRILKRNDSSSQWQDVSLPPINATVTYNAPFITVSGLTSFSDFAGAQDSTTQLSMRDSPTKPVVFALRQNYPNPFNPTTIIPYELPVASDVRLELFDVLGRKVATLVNAREDAGFRAVALNASALNLSSGVYFYRIQTGRFVATKKMLLVK